MEVKRTENKNKTPSTSAKRLVDKVINSNNDGSPFRFLPNFSTPPSRFFKIKNPFDSPLIEKLHLPTCSPSLFAKSTPKKDNKFKWTICEISTLKPAEIEVSSIELEQYVSNFDPSIESKIQEKISSYFNENSVVPSPVSYDIERNTKENTHWTPVKNNAVEASTQTNLCLGPVLPKHIEYILKSYENSEENKEYLPEDIYYKKLFETESPLSSPPMSTGDSPLQFSPIKEFHSNFKNSSSDSLDKKNFGECGLSPITPKIGGISQKERSCFILNRESKSACRLIFSEHMSVDNCVPDVLDPLPLHGNSYEEEMKTSSNNSEDTSRENWEMEYKQFTEDYEESHMEISCPPTPNTGLFTSQRKRLSDSFKKFDEFNPLMSEVSSDVGYCSETTTASILPNSQEKMCNNLRLVSSTPTKVKH